MAKVELKQIVKTYSPGQEPTVKGVDLSIEDGEFFILLGPSGCGKSTLLRMIAGLEEITSGDLCIGPRRVNDVAPKDRDIAMVFQSYALYPHLTVRQNLAFGLEMRRTPKAEIARRVAEVAPALGLEPLLDRLPKALSGGQRQRVALGRAIVREPKVFLLDEPLSNLDAKLRGTMRVELKRLHQRLGTTMVYVTHDQVEAMTLGDRVAVMHEGRVQQVGHPMEVYECPTNRFVAGFLGSPPMNFLCGTLGGDELLPVVELGDGHRLELSASLDLAASSGVQVEAGVRPEDVNLSVLTEAEGGIPGTVAVTEPLGAETIVTVDTAFGVVVARVSAGWLPRVGERVALQPDPRRVHLFHADSGELLRPAVPAITVGAPATGTAAAPEPAPERELEAVGA